MKTVLIAGGSGLIGQHLSRMLEERSYRVIHLSRSLKPNVRYERFKWNVEQQTINDTAIEEADFIINLAGAGIVGTRWTEKRKKTIIDSRTGSTKLLLDAIKRTEKKTKAYISSSAIGFYGDTGEDLVDENQGPGIGFLSESCSAWERAITEAEDLKLRTVTIRTGIVLSTRGGAFEKMLLSFKFLMGTYFGNGQQWYSWIHIDDICRMFIEAIENDKMEGIFNGVAPNPVRNKELIALIGENYSLPSFKVPVPNFALRLGMGEMADTILFSTKVSAAKISKAGFEFKFPKLNAAIADLLARKI